jgi:hypothetical protein
MAVRLRTLAAVAVATGALLTPAAQASAVPSSADALLSTSIARAVAIANTTGVQAELIVPGADGNPCFVVSVLGPNGAVYVAFYQPVTSCI